MRIGLLLLARGRNHIAESQCFALAPSQMLIVDVAVDVEVGRVGDIIRGGVFAEQATVGIGQGLCPGAISIDVVFIAVKFAGDEIERVDFPGCFAAEPLDQAVDALILGA